MTLKLLIAGTGYLELLNIAKNGISPNGKFEILGFLDDNLKIQKEIYLDTK